jgi:valyl-tRNA synthetase
VQIGADDLQLEDRWVISRLLRAVGDAGANMEKRRLNDAAYDVFNFFRHEYCDWYLEAIKPRLRGEDADGEASRDAALQVAVLDLALSYKLLHPVMPFITEELWDWLPPASGFIAASPYPVSMAAAPFVAERGRFDAVMEITGVLRNLRSELGVSPGKRGRAVLRVPSAARAAVLQEDAGRIALLSKLETVTVVDGGDDPRPAGAGLAGDVEAFQLMAGLVDLDRERERLQKEMAKLEGWLRGARAKLGNENFLRQAPADVVQKQRDQLAENEAKVATLRERLAGLDA